jgi:hypothetical protein
MKDLAKSFLDFVGDHWWVWFLAYLIVLNSSPCVTP